MLITDQINNFAHRHVLYPFLYYFGRLLNIKLNKTQQSFITNVPDTRVKNDKMCKYLFLNHLNCKTPISVQKINLKMKLKHHWKIKWADKELTLLVKSG